MVWLNRSATPFSSEIYDVVYFIQISLVRINVSNFQYFLALSKRKTAVFSPNSNLITSCHSQIFWYNSLLVFIQIIYDFRVKSSINKTKYLLSLKLRIWHDFQISIWIFLNFWNARLKISQLIFLFILKNPHISHVKWL